MKPGPELDALVAEKVTGWEPDKKKWFHPKAQRCPAYSTDIRAAWEVVEKVWEIRDELWKREGSSSAYGVPNGRGCVGLNRGDGFWCDFDPRDGSDWSAEGESIPHAICLAALEAVG